MTMFVGPERFDRESAIAAVALAHKNARIIWPMLASGETSRLLCPQR